MYSALLKNDTMVDFHSNLKCTIFLIYVFGQVGKYCPPRILAYLQGTRHFQHEIPPTFPQQTFYTSSFLPIPIQAETPARPSLPFV